jgi:transposase, IS5 family
VGKTAEAKAGRYAHAQQWRRMRREIKRLRTWLGRVIRDVQRKAGEISGSLKTRIETAQRLYEQRRGSKNKLYALHAPEVECIAKGKARTPYEFGVKTSVAVTAKEGVVVGMRSMPGSPYDGHTLHDQLEQVQILTEVQPTMVLADRGYRGAQPPEGTRLLLSHAKGLPKALKKLLRRRQAIEPTIGHMKTDGLLARNWLKGSQGDAIHAVLCGAGHNIRLILAHLRVLLLALFGWLLLRATVNPASTSRARLAS